MKHFADSYEESIAFNLTKCKIDFIHESEDKNQGLDFYLPKQDVYIEVKQYHTERILKQLALKDNIVLLQGKKAIDLFNLILNQ